MKSATNSFKKKILVVSHMSKSFGAVESLQNYLHDRYEYVAIITHPLSVTEGNRTSIFRAFKGGQEVITRSIRRNPRLPAQLQYVVDFFLTIRMASKPGIKFDLCIAIDPLNAAASVFLRIFGICHWIAFYMVDFSQKRFACPILNVIYHLFDRFSLLNSDIAWSISTRITEVRRKQGAKESLNLLVPNTLDFSQFPPLAKEPNNKTVYYIGVLTKTKGVQEFIEVFPDVLALVPDLRVVMIGGGPYETELRQLVKHKGLNSRVEFYGYLPQVETFHLLAKGGIGLALYTEDDDYTRFCDPLKVKTYLALGVPVVMTDVPWIADDIRKKGMGLVVYGKQDVIEAIVKLSTDRYFFLRCRQNALDNSGNFDTSVVFDKAIGTTFSILST